MYVEDQIIALRPLRLENPFGWLICFEDRPLQGIPPKGAGPHLLFFSEENKAGAFITNRKAIFGEEPLSVVGVDSPDTLKSIALNPSGDPRYAAPPCGIVLDFDYATTKNRRVLAPAEVSRLLPVEIARAFGFRAGQAPVIKREASRSSPGMEPGDQPGQKRPRKIALITCGSLLALGLLLLCIGGAWYGMSQGVIPALPFLYTPTLSNTPTLPNTPTVAASPTATLPSTATALAWEINVGDTFASNIHDWPVGFDKGQYGSSNVAIQNGKLVSEIESIDDCWYWWYPDLPSVSDFDASMDVQRVEGSTSGDYGMIVRADSDTNSFYYFAINDTNQEYAFFVYQNEKWTRIHDWTFNAIIGTGKINRIEVHARGPRFVFLINGVVVGQTNDARLSSGKVGILSELYDSADKMKVEYDNLILQGNR